MLQGRRDEVLVVDFEPGTLMVFRGRYSLHRVSPVRGRTPRLIAVMNNATESDWMGTPRINEQVYGLRERG